MFRRCKQNERWAGVLLALTEGWVCRCGEEEGRPETPDHGMIQREMINQSSFA